MKNLIITLLLSSISILSVAQTPFTEKVVLIQNVCSVLTSDINLFRK